MSSIEQDILDYVAAHPASGREAIRRGAAPTSSDTTVWRALKRLVDAGRLEVSGKGRATSLYDCGRSRRPRALADPL